jgi:hypothetical protein
MPIGPKGQKRPRDANQLAKLIVDIATGQVEDREPTSEEQGKTTAAVARGKAGGPRGLRPRRIAMLILDPGTLDFLAPSINYNSCRDVVQLYSVRH